MFSVPDILVVSVLALLLFGPDRLPKLMRQAGRFMREVQNTSQGFISEMERAADLADHPVPPPAPAHANGDSTTEDVAGSTAPTADLPEHEAVEKAEPDASEPAVNENAEHSSNEHPALRNPPLGGSAI
jgi:TatA/E family protein of Tat protein translocase